MGLVVPLMQGLWRDGIQHQLAELCELTGAGEMEMTRGLHGLTLAQVATRLIAASTARVGALNPPGLDEVRALTVGDRERLLLAIYRLNMGSRIEAVARCADRRCGNLLELDLNVEDLLDFQPGEHSQEETGQTIAADGEEPIHRVAIETEAGRWQVQCRLPNGADQEDAARIARSDAATAADCILKRCVFGVLDAEGAAIPLESALVRLRTPLADAFLVLDPLAETTFVLTCPACGTRTTTLFDAADFLVARLAPGVGILTEVHRLARAYHWAEAEILALSRTRRRQYLELLAAEGVAA